MQCTRRNVNTRLTFNGCVDLIINHGCVVVCLCQSASCVKKGLTKLLEKYDKQIKEEKLGSIDQINADIKVQMQ